MFADDTTIPLPALYIDTVDPAVTYTDGRVKAGRLWLDLSTGTRGTLKKRNAANDGWDTLIDLDGVDGSTRFGADAGASDTYVVTLTPVPEAYETGGHYRFKANTANTGACTVNFNSLGAKTIKKAAGGITTDLADSDIRAGQWVDLVYDGTNFQMASQLGNAFIKPDGSVAFTADQSMGSHKLTNVTDPGSAQDAATKAYVDSTVGGGTSPTGAAGGALGGTYPNPTVKVSICIACSDETTALTTGTGKTTFRMPHAMTVTEVRASLTTAQSSGSIFTVDINEGGTTIISTKITIDNSAKTSTTATTPPVISDASLADDAEITIDIDQIGDGTAKGLKVYLIGTRS